MKNWFMRLLSCVLAIVLLLPITTTALPVFASSAVENTVVEEDEATKEAEEDYNSKLPIKAGDWNQAKKDLIVPPWNFFHNAVENEIRFLDGEMAHGELEILGVGRADLYKGKRWKNLYLGGKASALHKEPK